MTDHRVTFMRRASALLLISTALLWIALVDTRGGNSSTVVSLRALSGIIPVRPVIYTFTEHTPQADHEGFHLWKSAWQAAGFDARALRLEDAHSHPDFKTYSNAIGEILPFGHQDIKMKYFHYLAMTTVGGGFLTDMDVYPLWPSSYMKLPNLAKDGQFTVRCGSAKQASGCLMSGSGDEWNRIAIELLSSVQRQYTYLYNQDSNIGLDSSLPLWNDDHALQEIVSFANPSGRPMAKSQSQVLTSVQARDMKSTLAHFKTAQCHEHMDRLAVKLDDFIVSRTWIKQWNKDCVNKVLRDDLSLPKDA